MSGIVTVEDLNYILEFGTLHGKIDNLICQTSCSGSQQIKIYSSETYQKNGVNTALRIRARSIFSYVMKSWNPQIDTNFREKLSEIYLNTVYLFYTGTVALKAQYFEILQPATYTFINRSSEMIIFDGVLRPNQIFYYTETEETQYWLDCYLNSQLFNSLEIKIVNSEFDIKNFYENLFSS